MFHQLDEHGNPEDVVARVQNVIYTPWLGFNLFPIWKVGHKINCSVNPTGTQAGKLRFIRGSANDSLYATRLPPPTPVNVARESAPVSSACNPSMPAGVSRYPVSSACNPPVSAACNPSVSSASNPPMPVGVSRESAFVSAACMPPPGSTLRKQHCTTFERCDGFPHGVGA